MRHQKKGRKLNRTASHRKALFSNLAASLVIHKKIRTTEAKGKELRTYVERLVTYAKRGDIHGRRLIQKKISGKRGKEIANILLHDIAPAFADRQGGYTRLIKLNNRKNDNAPVSLVEFVDIAADVIEPDTDDGEDKEKEKVKE
tara:strand:- start:106 stop:537 length:432 start_codon:yes stop_codon:yes gene_type:complete